MSLRRIPAALGACLSLALLAGLVAPSPAWAETPTATAPQEPIVQLTPTPAETAGPRVTPQPTASVDPTVAPQPSAAATPTPTTTPEPTPAPVVDAVVKETEATIAAQGVRTITTHAATLGSVRTGAVVSTPGCVPGAVCHAQYERLSLTWSQKTGIVTHKPSREALTRRPLADVRAGTQFQHEMEWLSAVGVTTGYPDGTYRPLHFVERGAMAAFLYRMAGSPAYQPPATPTFADVPTHHAFYRQIEWLADVRVTTGWEEDHQRWFRPESAIARDAMAAFLYRFAGSPSFAAPSRSPFADIRTDQMFYREMAWLYDRRLSTGYGEGDARTYRPGTAILRDAMAAFLYRAVPVTHGVTLPRHGQLPPLPPPPPQYRMVQPAGTNGSPTSPFGYRLHPVYRTWRLHNGIDLGNRTGQPIIAAADGVVTKAGWTSGGGNSIYLQHHGLGDVSSRYLHMSSFTVSPGQHVSRGQLIGYMGATGSVTHAHLHFSVVVNGSFVNPEEWIGPISSLHA